MNTKNINIMSGFGLENIPDLDVAVLAALELFGGQALPSIDVSEYKRPLVVGSGNAEATGRIVFEASDAVFASESNFAEKLKAIPAIDGVILVSASGGKHAPIIVEAAHAAGKSVTLITNTSKSPASEKLAHNRDHEFVFPKNREPYTYNTSTYMGMILGKTAEDPAAIFRFIQEKIDPLVWPDFSDYDKYYLIVPPQFSNIIRMLQVKFIELFGRNIARDVETSEYVRHATTVAPSDELFITFGEPNTMWGTAENRFNVPLPENANYGAMMAIGYYVIAHIQKAYPHFFKDNIVNWAIEISDMFGETLAPIVEK